jgi:hypothetical protein
MLSVRTSISQVYAGENGYTEYQGDRIKKMIYVNAPRKGRDIRPRDGGRNQFIFRTSECASVIQPSNRQKENNAKKKTNMHKMRRITYALKYIGA